MHPPEITGGPIVGRHSMHNHLERDLIGYGPDTPDPQWPGEARIAVSFVLELRGGRREHHPERRSRLRSVPDRDAGRHADRGRPRSLDRVDVRIRQPRGLLAHPASLRRARAAFHLLGGRPGAGAEPCCRQGDGGGRPRGREPRLSLDQLQGLHPRAGARPHAQGGEGDRRRRPARRRSAGTPAASACSHCAPW